MQAIKWQQTDFRFEEDTSLPDSLASQDLDKMSLENEDPQFTQHKKYQNPSKDDSRKAYLALLDRFSQLFTSEYAAGIVQEIFTEDFEAFITRSVPNKLPLYADNTQRFIDLLKSFRLLERRIRETDVDVEKHTACQICNCAIIYEDEQLYATNEVSIEVFTFKDGKISKYRSCFGHSLLEEQDIDPLAPTRKDKMLAKVKELNYALASPQPDFEKVAGLLHETTEYKIWRWDDFKCFTVHKNEFVSSFRSLQENMSIKSVVPYELITDNQSKAVTGNYVYHIEDNSSGQKFEWLCTCIYGFDENLNIIHVSQQGELYPEGEVEIPFGVYTREKLENKATELYSNVGLNLDVFYSDDIIYDCAFWTFCFTGLAHLGYFEGLKHVDRLLAAMELIKDWKMDFTKLVDIYVDHQNKSHDVLFAVICCQGKGFSGALASKDENTNAMGFLRLAFENGRLAKVYEFWSEVPGPMKSPFDDKSFMCLNMK